MKYFNHLRCASALCVGVFWAVLMTQAHAQALTDAAGRAVDPGKAERILSLGPDVTEILYALGAGDRVVGVDRGSRYPEATLAKPNVGYRRSLSAEGVLALDLILSSHPRISARRRWWRS